MKRNMFLLTVTVLMIICFVPSSVLSTQDKVTFKDGSMIFPANDQISDLDFLLVEFDLDAPENIPPQVRPIIGKVYRGVFGITHAMDPKSLRGSTIYTFLTKWKGEGVEFFASFRTRTGPRHFPMTCSLVPPKDSSVRVRCRNKWWPNQMWYLSTNEGRLFIDAENAWDAILSEVGRIPAEYMMKK